MTRRAMLDRMNFFTTPRFSLSLSLSRCLCLSPVSRMDGRTASASSKSTYAIIKTITNNKTNTHTHTHNYKPTLLGSSSINFVGSRPKISPVAPFHSPTRIPQSLCVSIATSPTGYAMHNNVNPSFCSSSSKVKSRSVMSDWSVAPETHFATHALRERIDNNNTSV